MPRKQARQRRLGGTAAIVLWAIWSGGCALIGYDSVGQKDNAGPGDTAQRDSGTADAGNDAPDATTPSHPTPSGDAATPEPDAATPIDVTDAAVPRDAALPDDAAVPTDAAMPFPDAGSSCNPGQVQCMGTTAYRCDGDGLWTEWDCLTRTTQCAIGHCDPEQGCVARPIAAGTACDDGSPCTTDDSCQAGNCNGQPVDCSHLDGVCNAGSCTADGQCVSLPLPDGTPCDDLLACVSGYCVNGIDCAGSSSCSALCNTPATDCGLACASSAICDLTCEQAATCVQNCEGTAQCQAACSGASSCMVDCSGAAHCSASCADSSSCSIDCTGATQCSPVRCQGNSACTVDCSGSTVCNVRCEDLAGCSLHCGNNISCAFEACNGTQVDCGDGTVVCNMPCP